MSIDQLQIARLLQQTAGVWLTAATQTTKARAATSRWVFWRTGSEESTEASDLVRACQVSVPNECLQVLLGFLEEPVSPAHLLRHRFPSKVGGRPVSTCLSAVIFNHLIWTKSKADMHGGSLLCMISRSAMSFSMRAVVLKVGITINKAEHKKISRINKLGAGALIGKRHATCTNGVADHMALTIGTANWPLALALQSHWLSS